jgi:hypothetical protein
VNVKPPGVSMKVGTEKKETNPVKPLDKIKELDKDGIRVESKPFWKKRRNETFYQ